MESIDIQNARWEVIMSKYVITFSKTGDIKFTSHLDINRMFRRIFRKVNVDIAYSQGFNPHPKMNFAQPLSLGYEALNEMLEITTKTDYEPERLKELITNQMPDGMKVLNCQRISDSVSSLAALAVEATYELEFPVTESIDFHKLIEEYLLQDEIIIEKLNKKKRKITINIREKIRDLYLKNKRNDKVTIVAKLDCGSASNVSPEYVISTLIQFGNLNIKREEVDVTRMEIKLVEKVCNSIQK